MDSWKWPTEHLYMGLYFFSRLFKHVHPVDCGVFACCNSGLDSIGCLSSLMGNNYKF